MNESGCFSGHSTASFSSCFTVSRPPTSAHFTFGTSTRTSLSADGLTIFSASLKSFLPTFSFSSSSFGSGSFFSYFSSGSILLSTIIAASFANAAKSAPTKPCVVDASSFRFTSLSNGMFLVWILSTLSLPSLFGTPISSSLSNLPGRLSAGSSMFGTFVAAITTTFPLDFSPSISASSCATTLLSTSPFVSSLFVAIASISSMNMIDGAFFSASSNFFLRFSSDCP